LERQDNIEVIIPLLIAAFFVSWIYVSFTKKGKGMFFGGQIVETIGDKVGTKRGIINANVKVHVIKTKLPEPNSHQVGLELSQSSFLSYQMSPITLTHQEAVRLSEMLKEASEYGRAS
jgi:hypothetical protein